MDKKCGNRQKTVKTKTDRRGKNLNKENVQKQDITQSCGPGFTESGSGSRFRLFSTSGSRPRFVNVV